MKRHTAVFALAGLVALAGTARADDTNPTYCNAFITTLPYVISSQGHYCFNKNLSTAITSGNAITINVDFVVLDLNNFKLGGGGAGLGTNAVGIYARQHRNITVRGGNIRGFRLGIQLVGTIAGNIVVENNAVDGNTYRGIWTDGDSSIIRNNLVTNTGGTTAAGNQWAYGIYGEWGSTPSGSYGTALAEHNVVTNTFGPALNSVYGIGVLVADHNLVTLGNTGGTPASNTGIWATICRDNTVIVGGTGGTAYNNCSNSVGANFP